jgi:hypothetical protein
VSPEIVARVLEGDTEAFAQLRSYLVGDGAQQPEEITRRATALISQIGAQRGVVGTDALLQIIDQVATSAINLVAGSQIVRIGIDRDFVPTKAVLAWDFGPPDGEVSPGFERVQPGDGRISGAALDGLRRPAESDLLNDGLVGVERIEADVPDGEYRIILMTQNLGDQQLMERPFGSEIVVNGSALSINDPSPDNWLQNAVLSNRGVQNVSAPATGGPGGFIAGDLDNFDQGMFERQQGGAIIINATARNGKLIIELKGFNNARSYLTGLMVEPATETSDLVLSREAMQAVTPVEMRLALEEEILSSAARVLAELNPAEGDPELVELPEPILDPEELASASE